MKKIKNIKLNILIIAAVLAFVGISTAVLAVTGTTASSGKASQAIDDTYMTNALTKAFGKNKSDIVALKANQGTMDKVYYKLLCDKKNEIKTDKLVYDLYDKGYSLQDIDTACEYAAASGLSPEKILQTKGKDGRYELVKEKNEKGEEVEKVIDNNTKLWDAAVNKLKLDFGTYSSMLGSTDKTYKGISNDRMTGRQKFDMLMLSHRYNASYNDVYKEVKAGKQLSEVKNKYVNKLEAENTKVLTSQSEVSKFTSSAEAFSTADSDINNLAFSQAQYKKYITTPYSIKDFGERTISPVTGDMEIKTTDLSLKGINGLDFNLTRYYSLQQSNIYYVYYDNNKNIQERDRYTLNDKLYDIGAGWAFDLPFLVTNGSGYPKELHMGSKGTLYIAQNSIKDYDSETKRYAFSDYNLKDISLKKDVDDKGTLMYSFSNGQSQSEWYMEEKDGKRYYFNNDGYLIGETDRFGNSIKYQYQDREYINLTVKSLSCVIDSVGREIRFNYDDVNHKLTVSVYGDEKTKKIVYQKQPIINQVSDSYKKYVFDNEYYLQTVTDAESRVTSYEYDFNLCKANMDNRYVQSELGLAYGIDNFCACLKKIAYPSGGYSSFFNVQFTKCFGQTGSMQFYKMLNSEDHNTTTTASKNYSYKFDFSDEYDGWPYNASIGTTTTIATNIDDHTSNYEKCIFNNKLECTSSAKTGTDHKYETINGYDSDGQITKVTNRTYNPSTGDYIERIESYYYDKYRDLINYWNTRAEGNTADTEYKTTYQYNPVNHFPVSKTYKKDANTTITEEYTASSDNKTIDYFRVKENDVLKKQTQYIYDPYGNVIEERNYLDNWKDYISTKYSYDDNVKARNGKFNGLYLTRKYTDGVTDIKDNAVSARTGNIAGTVDETYTYDWFGNLKQKTDANGNLSSYDYDKLGRVKKQINPDLSFKLWEYTTNANENSVLLTDENNKQFKYGYDKLGNLIYEQDMTSGEYLNQYTYDRNLRLVNEKNNTSSESNHEITYEYTSDGRVKVKSTFNKSGSAVSREEYSYDDAYLDAATGNKYEKVNKRVVCGANAIFTNTYTNKYGLVEKTGRMHNGTEYFDTFKYDYLGNKTEEKTASANSEAKSLQWTAKYEYNYEGKPTKVYNVNGDYISTAYDALGRTTAVTDIKGNKATIKYSTTYSYDKLGRVIEEKVPFSNDSGTISYSIKRNYYDRNGNLTTVEQSSNKPGEAQAFNQTDYEYNNRNLLTKVTTYNNSTPANYTQYYYDAVGNKIRMYTGLNAPLIITGPDTVVTKGSVTKYEYNQFGQLTKMTDPLGKEENYDYDKNGNMLTKTDRNGNVITNSYDALNRVLSTSVVTPDAKGNASHSYTYGMNGLRDTMDGTSYKYDDLGRLETESNGNITKVYTYYDATNYRETLVIKQGDTVKTNTKYEYDKMNRLEKVYENSQLIATYHYNENGNRDKLTNTNGTSTDYLYNLANKLDTLTNNKGTTAVSKYTYSYYLNGNQASKTDLAGKVTSYVYDGLGRLSSEAPSGEPTISYKYDDYNNRETMTVAGVSSTAYAYDKNNRLQTETKTAGTTTETTNYSYDDNGNQISKATETLKTTDSGEAVSLEASADNEGTSNSGVTLSEYNGFNQLTKTTSDGTAAAYTYNGDGLRTSKTVNGTVTKHIWDGDQIALETDSAGNVTNKYVRGINLLYAENTAGTRQYYLFNGHGDVVQLTGTDGSVTKNYDYDAFGNEKNPDANDTNVFRYCGEYFDKETGTVYLRARYYDPATSRMLSEDSVWSKKVNLFNLEEEINNDSILVGGVYRGENGDKFIIDDPLSLNLYTYCQNDPIQYYDPSGNFGIDVKKGYEFMSDVYQKFPGFVKNTKTFVTSYGNRIPDFLNKVVVGEIKNVKYQHLSSQIRGFMEMAQKQGKTFVLVIKEGTKLSKPLIDEIIKSGGKIIKVGADGVSKMMSTPIIVIPDPLLDIWRQNIDPKYRERKLKEMN